MMGFLESVVISDAFSVSYHVPELNKEDVKKVNGVHLCFLFWSIELKNHKIWVKDIFCTL